MGYSAEVVQRARARLAQERSDLVYLEKLPLFNPDGSVKG